MKSKNNLVATRINFKHFLHWKILESYFNLVEYLPWTQVVPGANPGDSPIYVFGSVMAAYNSVKVVERDRNPPEEPLVSCVNGKRPPC